MPFRPIKAPTDNDFGGVLHHLLAQGGNAIQGQARRGQLQGQGQAAQLLRGQEQQAA